MIQMKIIIMPNYQILDALDELCRNILFNVEKVSPKPELNLINDVQHSGSQKIVRKLPLIELQCFSNNTEWPIFYEYFKNFIDENT